MKINRIINSITALLLMQIVLLNSCENINPQDDGKGITANHLELDSDNDFYSLIETALDVCEQIEGTGIPTTWNGLSLGKVYSMDAKDSVFYDGDEVRFELNFGTITDANNAGGSIDQRFRYGRVEFRIDKYFKEIGAVAEVKFDSPFCSSKDDEDLFTGELILTRVSSNTVKVEIKSLKIWDESNQEIEIEGALNYKCLSAISAEKVWGNEFEITGNLMVLFLKQNPIALAKYEITKPLIRKLESGCNNSPVAGIIQCNFDNEALSAKVDYDPFENQACDDLVRVSTKDKVFDFIIE